MSVFLYKIFGYWNTLRYLRIVQITGRIWRNFKQVKIDLSAAEDLRELAGTWVKPVQQDKRMVGKNTFRFLNETHQIKTAADWNSDKWAKLWIYNLHYFDDLNAVDSEQRVDWHRSLIQRWIDENPPGSGCGWEPYPSSLRIVNWIKWALFGNQLDDGWINSLAVQVRLLKQNLETHLLGNHLFANAKALLFAGLFFDGEEANSWYKTGKKLVEQELPEQVLADGGNFELSTMYHVIFLEDLMDLVNLHKTYSKIPPHGISEKIPPMFKWLEIMSHPDGKISLFNDAAHGIRPDLLLYSDYGIRLLLFPDRLARIKGFSDSTAGFIDLSESGYSRVQMGDAVALIDRAAVGPDYLPGHAHADTLSFELSLFGQRVVVNSGTSVYGIGADRQWQRSTVAHSTVMIDGEDSSEVWGSFRVARRARVFDREEEECERKVRLSACHDGYKRLSGNPVHCREWLFEEGKLTLFDKITGQGEHEVMIILPLYPEVKVIDIGENRVLLDVVGNNVEVVIDGKGILEVMKSNYHPEFGLSINNSHLIFRSHAALPSSITTRIGW